MTVSVSRTGAHAAGLSLSIAANAQGMSGGGVIADAANEGTILLPVPANVLPASYSLAVLASDGSQSRGLSFDLLVLAAQTIVTASPLAVASVGAVYSLDFGVAGGLSPYAWSLVGGGLPAGMSLSAGGSLSGTPSAAGAFAFTVQVTDGTGVITAKDYTLLVTGALLPSLGGNGSFEQGLSGWSQLGSGSGVTYAIVSDAVDNVNAVRVTNRAQLYHAPGQNVFSSFLANANGTPVTSRFWIKLDAPGMARLSINLTSSSGGASSTANQILAEQVVRAANVWVEVSGTTTLAWNGALTAAMLEFNIGQPVELAYPGFTLDDVRIQRDADADGLPDVDEAVNEASNPDRDNDGLSDGWETQYALTGKLDPNMADAAQDADADGFTNHQEFWAATDPLNSTSLPGVPSAGGATAQVLALVRYLALLPSQASKRVISGQHLTGQTSLGGVSGEFTSNVQALFDQTGKWPGILSMQYEGGDASIGPLQINAVNTQALDWAATGGLVLIKYQPFDPWTLVNSSPAGGVHVDLVGLLNPAAGDPAKLAANTAANAVWLDWLDQIADGLDELQQAGVVVLWRPNSEMNNGAHWHSRQPRDAWIAVWRHMHDYFTNTRNLKNLIWVYEGDSVAHAVVPADYYYPGDDVVDLMGHNFYDDDWALPYDLNALFRRYPKIYGFPQAGSQSVRDGSWDNTIMITGIQQRSPRASLFCTWNDFYTGGGVFTARSMVSQANAAGLLSDPWVITREELSW